MDRGPEVSVCVCCMGACLIGLVLYGVSSRDPNAESDNSASLCHMGKHFELCETAGQLMPASGDTVGRSKLVESRWLHVELSLDVVCTCIKTNYQYSSDHAMTGAEDSLVQDGDSRVTPPIARESARRREEERSNRDDSKRLPAILAKILSCKSIQVSEEARTKKSKLEQQDQSVDCKIL